MATFYHFDTYLDYYDLEFTKESLTDFFNGIFGYWEEAGNGIFTFNIGTIVCLGIGLYCRKGVITWNKKQKSI